jgi:hypothetical protein
MSLELTLNPELQIADNLGNILEFVKTQVTDSASAKYAHKKFSLGTGASLAFTPAAEGMTSFSWMYVRSNTSGFIFKLALSTSFGTDTAYSLSQLFMASGTWTGFTLFNSSTGTHDFDVVLLGN